MCRAGRRRHAMLDKTLCGGRIRVVVRQEGDHKDHYAADCYIDGKHILTEDMVVTQSHWSDEAIVLGGLSDMATHPKDGMIYRASQLIVMKSLLWRQFIDEIGALVDEWFDRQIHDDEDDEEV
jgi:precorrin-4 methylase